MSQIRRRNIFRGSVAAIGLWLTPSASFAEEHTGQHKSVEPVTLPLDGLNKQGVYTLNFAYTPVRIITVDTPDRGKRTVWYMVYQVWNRTDTPRPFTPEFLLVTKDGSDIPAKYLDDPTEPLITKKIREIEDPTGALNIQTSNSISKERIPVTKPDSIPRAVHGVAIWPDVAEKSARTNRFSVYVTGLSNGISRADTDDGGSIISRKTLQIDFVRPTDHTRHEHDDIVPNDNNGLGAEKWIYREVGKRKAAKKDGEQ
jgi:hypothetical protein